VPLVSVIIPAYRAARTINRAVDSVLAQEGGVSIEVLVVDDGSPDDISGPLSRYGPSVTHIRKPNGGASSARNVGIERAQGELLAFLDADDFWEPAKLQKQLDVLRRHQEVGLVAAAYFVQEPGGSRRLAFGGGGADFYDRSFRPTGREIFDVASMIWTSTVVARRSAVGSMRFDTGLRVAEDRDMWIRLVTSASVYLIGEPLATAILEPASLSRSGADDGYSPMLQVVRRYAHLVSSGTRRKLEARVFRGWAARHLSSGDARAALSPALNRLKRDPLSAEAWWVALRCAGPVIVGRGGNRATGAMRQRDQRPSGAGRAH
jgi:glycosyltransferase involved in cell wall biosynthesis